MTDQSEQGADREETKAELSITVMADKVTVYGPKVDNSFTLKFDTGEYEQLNLAKIMAISQSTSIKLTIEPQNE